MNSPVSRRGFLKGSAVLGGGLVVAFVVPGAHRFARAAENEGKVFAPNALRIAADNSVTVLLGHSEMGQGIWTGLTMLIAEELDADWSKIRVEHSRPRRPITACRVWRDADYRRLDFDLDGVRPLPPGRGHGAADADRSGGQALQRGAVEIRTESGVVIAGDKRATYGELADDAGQLPVPDPKSITSRRPRTGRSSANPPNASTPRKNHRARQVRHGRAVRRLDDRDGRRAPVFGGSVKSFEGAEALAVPAHKVVQVPTGVAVIAEHYWAAKLGRDALKVDWDLGPNTASTVKNCGEFPQTGRHARHSGQSGGRSRRRWPRRARPLMSSTACRTWPMRRWNRSTAR
jgi:isoquinoline 1-oxidoreductase beta subunit